MKIAKFIIAFFCLSALSACIDTEEYIVINEDNSGTYTMQIDMGKIFEMANQMGAEDVSTSKIEKMDSTIYLKDMVSTADNLSADEKELYKNGIIKIKLDKPGKEMKIIMTCPFKSINQLPEIKNNFYVVINKLKALDKLSGKAAESADPAADKGMAEKALTPGSAFCKFMAAPGKIEYKILDTAGIGKMISTDSTAMMVQQMVSMMGEMSYKTKITTTKGFKNYSGNNASLSADKKTITFTNTFSDMFEHPEKFAYKIEY
jgi:hypothetical protein